MGRHSRRVEGGDGLGGSDGGDAGRASGRAMSTLLSLVTAVAVLTIVTGGTIIVVEDAFRDTDRGDGERAVALQASDRLVAPDGPLAERSNVILADELAELDESDLEALGGGGRFAMAVSVDGERHASVGELGTGHVIRRIVLLEERRAVDRTPTVAAQEGHEVTVPVRTADVDLELDPPPGTTVTAVRSDGHVVLQNASGLAGTHSIDTARYDTLALTFETEGPLSTGDVHVAYDATQREMAILAVTVDDETRAGPRGEAA